MSLSLDKIYIKHWIRTIAPNVRNFIKDKPIGFLDLVMHYIHIEDSIHYECLKTNNYTLYDEYIHTSGQKDHSQKKFKILRDEWTIEKMQPINLTVEFDLLCVIDGVHRLAIFKYLYDTDRIPLKFVNINYPIKVIDEISKALIETTTTIHYNGWTNGRLKHGYHSFEIYNVKFEGQRNPKIRLDIMRKFYNFENKIVLDLGCNTGGMLFHLSEIKQGVGVDFDIKCIDACNVIKQQLKLFDYLEFQQQDLNNVDLNILLTNTKPDVVFLLSLGSWVKNWPAMYTTVIKNTQTIILETNNSHEGKAQLDLFEKLGCTITLISPASYDDITKNSGRQTYLINTTKTSS